MGETKQKRVGRPRKRAKNEEFESSGASPGDANERIKRRKMTEVVDIKQVQHISHIQFGKHLLKCSYFSPYPEEIDGTNWICESCFDYVSSARQAERHGLKCSLKTPPGNEIYRDSKVSFWEVDGAWQRTYCRNLSLFAKCFLESKSVEHDVNIFNYYVMTEGGNVVGYFSKSKLPFEDYNLACVLTFPQYWRKGYGSLLMDFSYMLSNKEGRLGTPEKPISKLGRSAYLDYWFSKLFPLLLLSNSYNIEALCQKTGMIRADVVDTLREFGMLFQQGSETLIMISSTAKKIYDAHCLKRRHVLDPNLLVWL
jgi:histone acetyltransferase HTATIP